MPIRKTYRNKCLDDQQVIEGTDFILPLAGYPKPWYKDRKQELRVYADQFSYYYVARSERRLSNVAQRNLLMLRV